MVSQCGRVKSKEYKLKRSNGVVCTLKEKIMKLNEFSNGYLGVQLYDNDGKKTQLVHRLVAEAFIPNPENKPQVNHIDFNRSNNDKSNLEWVTIQENFNHAKEKGSFEWSKERKESVCGENNNSSNLTENEVRSIREKYKTGDFTQSELANIHNTSQNNISRIVRKKNWAHI